MFRQLFSTLISVLFLVALTNTPSAQDGMSAEDIVKELSKKPLTRGLKSNSLSLDQMNALSNISRSTRGITIEQRVQLNAIVVNTKLAALDFEINFAFDSDRLDSNSIPMLNQIGIALSSKALADSTVVVAGHTDAVGRKEYNQNLSERRAITVKQFLVQNFSLDPKKLVVAGYGQEMLKNSVNPYADENRRVQLINLGTLGQPSQSQNLFENPEQNTQGESVTANKVKSEEAADPLSPFDGSWVSVNPPGPQVLFYRTAFGQRAASLSFGVAQIRISDGTSGSNIKVSGEGFDCYYSVGFTSASEMVWQLKQGSALCSTSSEYRRLLQ